MEAGSKDGFSWGAEGKKQAVDVCTTWSPMNCNPSAPSSWSAPWPQPVLKGRTSTCLYQPVNISKCSILKQHLSKRPRK